MFAGILFPLCLAPVRAELDVPLLAIPVMLVWPVLYRLAPGWAVPAAIVVAGVLLTGTSGSGWLAGGHLAPRLGFVAPVFDPFVVVGLAVPLFIQTKAGQSIPGAAILHNFGYRPRCARRWCRRASCPESARASEESRSTSRHWRRR